MLTNAALLPVAITQWHTLVIKLFRQHVDRGLSDEACEGAAAI
jgi:hypothetical protein